MYTGLSAGGHRIDRAMCGPTSKPDADGAHDYLSTIRLYCNIAHSHAHTRVLTDYLAGVHPSHVYMMCARLSCT
jgi:hypothetical protein